MDDHPDIMGKICGVCDKQFIMKKKQSLIWFYLIGGDYSIPMSEELNLSIVESIMWQFRALSYEEGRLEIMDLMHLLKEIIEKVSVDSKVYSYIREWMVKDKEMVGGYTLGYQKTLDRVMDYLNYKKSWFASWMTYEVWLGLRGKLN